MEVLVCATLADDVAIADRAMAIRTATRIHLPDAIVWASAQVKGLLLVMRNTRVCPVDEPGVRVPYTLQAGRTQTRRGTAMRKEDDLRIGVLADIREECEIQKHC
jgi:hypothetical protein